MHCWYFAFRIHRVHHKQWHNRDHHPSYRKKSYHYRRGGQLITRYVDANTISITMQKQRIGHIRSNEKDCQWVGNVSIHPNTASTTSSMCETLCVRPFCRRIIKFIFIEKKKKTIAVISHDRLNTITPV